MKKITPNTKITVQFVTDAQLRPEIEVIARTSVTATLKLNDGKIVRRKIYSNDEREYVFPYGMYSMAPIAY